MAEEIKYRKSGLGGYFLLVEFGERKYTFRLPERCSLCQSLIINERDVFNACGCALLAMNILGFLYENFCIVQSEAESLCLDCYRLEFPEIDEFDFSLGPIA